MPARKKASIPTKNDSVANLGVEADFGPEHADSFRRDLHPDPALRDADYVLANQPFNDSDWFRKGDDVRWPFGVTPKGNANFAWVEHLTSVEQLATKLARSADSR